MPQASPLLSEISKRLGSERPAVRGAHVQLAQVLVASQIKGARRLAPYSSGRTGVLGHPAMSELINVAWVARNPERYNQLL